MTVLQSYSRDTIHCDFYTVIKLARYFFLLMKKILKKAENYGIVLSRIVLFKDPYKNIKVDF